MTPPEAFPEPIRTREGQPREKLARGTARGQTVPLGLSWVELPELHGQRCCAPPTMDEATVDHTCDHLDVRALDSRRVRWSVSVGDEIEVGTVLARCTLPSMSPSLEGASAPGLEIRSDHKGELVQRLLEEGELMTEGGTRRGQCVLWRAGLRLGALSRWPRSGCLDF